MTQTFKIGDKVKRRLNKENTQTGKVIKIKPRAETNDLNSKSLNHFYTVKWDDGTITEHHLACGLIHT